jgi:tetratricopeptide (TPR) repeat protein
MRLVELQLASGRARQALATLAPLVEAGERDPIVRTYYGIALGRVGRVAEARSVLEQVVAESPDLALASRALGVLEQQARIVGDDEALALEGDAAVAFEQGLSALETGDWSMAAAGFATARESTDAGLLAFYHGYALQRAGDSRAAIAAYGDARESLGDNDILLSNLGFAHLQLGRLDLALEALEAAVASNPGNAQAHFNLGLAEFGVARFVAAVASFERAVELAPELAQTAEPFLFEARRRSQ